MNLLKELQQETTILYSTHILNDAEEMTDQLLFLRKGTLVEQGSLDDVRARYAKPKILIEFERPEELDVLQDTSPWNLTTINGLVYQSMLLQKRLKCQLFCRCFTKENFRIRKVERQTASLEEIFMEVAVIQ